MNALSLAVCGDCPDVIKVLVDEFNVPLKAKGPVSIGHVCTLIHCNCLTNKHVHCCMYVYVLTHSVCTITQTTLPVLQLGKTLFHRAADENSRECLKLLVYHFKVDPDEPDIVSCSKAHFCTC